MHLFQTLYAIQTNTALVSPVHNRFPPRSAPPPSSIHPEREVSHRSGTTLTIAPNGAITVETSIPLTKPGASVKTKMPGANITLAGNFNLKSKFSNINIESDKGTININASTGDINIGKNAVDTEVNGKMVPSETKQKVNNFKQCLYTGAPHCDPIALPNVNVYV